MASENSMQYSLYIYAQQNKLDPADLPIELQIQIFEDIPPLSLLTLRRVCKSWNQMLSNPNLLRLMDRKLPFLTSAPDFTSRMKRRKRLQSNNPVWVKRLDEAFPWSKPQNEEPKQFLKRFLDGYFVTLTVESPKIILKIGHVTSPSQVVEIDVLAIFQDQYSQLYHGASLLQVAPPPVESFHLHVQQQKVLVGLRTTLMNEKRKRGPGLEETENHEVCEMYFLVFDLLGTLVTLIHESGPENAAGDLLILSRLASAHLLTVHLSTLWRTTELNEGTSNKLGWAYGFRFNIYSTRTSPGTAVSPEWTLYANREQDWLKRRGFWLSRVKLLAGEICARVVFREDGVVLVPGFRDEINTPTFHLYRYLVSDNENRQGRLWWDLQKLPGTALRFILKEDVDHILETKKTEDKSCVSTSEPLNFDHTNSIYQIVEPRLLSPVVIHHQQKMCQVSSQQGFDAWLKDTHPEITHTKLIPDADYEKLRGEFQPTRQSRNIRYHNTNYGSLETTTMTSFWKTTTSIYHPLAIPQSVSLVIRYSATSYRPKGRRQWCQDGGSQDVTAQTPIVWGYITVNSDPDSIINPEIHDGSANGRSTYQLRTPLGDLLLLPYKSGFQEWKKVDNGLPSLLVPHVTYVNRTGQLRENYKDDYGDWTVHDDDPEASIDMKGIRWMWGDDGMICWKVTTGLDETGNKTKSQMWLVCYEETWVPEEDLNG